MEYIASYYIYSHIATYSLCSTCCSASEFGKEVNYWYSLTHVVSICFRIVWAEEIRTAARSQLAKLV